MKLIKCNWTNRKIKPIVYQKEGSFFENVKKNMKYQIRCKKHTKFASIKFCDFANFRKFCKMLEISRSWFTKFYSRNFVFVNFFHLSDLRNYVLTKSDFLRILTRKKHRQMKLQCLQKVKIWVFGLLVQQINSLWEVLKLKHNFQKNKVVTGKTPFFLVGPFCSDHFSCLNIGFWYDSFVWKWCVLNLSTFK